MIDTIVFDVGRVLIEWDMYALYRKLLPDDAAIAAFLAETKLPEWNVRFDAGTPFAEGVAAMSALHPDHADLIKAFDARWAETSPGAISGTVDILAQLNADDVPLYAITNFSDEKWPVACEKHPFLATSFRDVVVSGREGTIKPDAAIFNALLERNDLAAERCFFIDDSPKNVDGARAVGMQAHLFETPEGLAKELRSLGFLNGKPS